MLAGEKKMLEWRKNLLTEKDRTLEIITAAIIVARNSRVCKYSWNIRKTAAELMASMPARILANNQKVL